MKAVINFLFLLVLLTSSTASAGVEAPSGEAEPPPAFQALWGLYALPEGTDVGAPNLAVLFVDMEPGWYIYDHRPQPSGMPTKLAVTFDPGGNALEVVYPPAEEKDEPTSPTGKAMVYQGKVPLFIPLGALPSDPFTLKANLSMLACSKTTCRPERKELLFLGAGIDPARLAKAEDQPFWPLFLAATSGRDAPEGKAPPKPSGPAPDKEGVSATGPGGGESPAAEPDGPEWNVRPEYFSPSLEVSGLAAAALLGLLAGLILNVMPCVLPVIALKLHGLLAGHEGESAETRMRAFRVHNVFFALGILACFLALSAVLALTGMAWGQMFQGQWFVLAMAAGVFVLSLSLFGVFHLPVVDLKAGTGTGDPRLQAFLTGLMATVLATPCSGPLLGGVLGWALVQPALVLSLVMAFVGLGMALPYVLLAAAPSLVRFLPKPGAWSGYLEKIVGFFLLGTCIYLLNILPYPFLIPAMAMLLASGVAAWLWGLAGPEMRSSPRLVLRMIGLALFAASIAWAASPRPQEALWTTFTPEAFTENLGKSPMLVDFTANWCPTCKFLEKTVLTQENMSQWQEEFGVVFLKADLTRDNPPAQRLLTLLGSRSIPVAALFPAGNASQTPLVLRDLFTKGQMTRAMERTFAKESSR